MNVRKQLVLLGLLVGFTQTAKSASLVSSKVWYTDTSVPHFEIIVEEGKGDLSGKEFVVELNVSDKVQGTGEREYLNSKKNRYERIADNLENDKLKIGSSMKNIKQRFFSVRQQGKKYIITIDGNSPVSQALYFRPLRYSNDPMANYVAAMTKKGGGTEHYYYKPQKWHMYMTIKPRPPKRKKVLDEDFSKSESEIIFQRDIM